MTGTINDISQSNFTSARYAHHHLTFKKILTRGELLIAKVRHVEY